MGPVDSDSLSRVESYSGARLSSFPCRVRDYHPLWSAFPDCSARVLEDVCPVLQPHRDMSPWFGLLRFRSPLLTESIFLSLPPGTEMFQFPGLARCTYGFNAPHSGISGSALV